MIRYDYASVAVYDESAHSLSLYPLDSPLTIGLGWPGHDASGKRHSGGARA